VSLADELLKLEQLRDSGALTEAEFQAAKRTLLNPPPRPLSGPATSETNSLGHAANRYVTNSTILGVAGLVIILIIVFCVFVPMLNRANSNGDLCAEPNVTCTR
jgi:Short C-terminal domain